MGRRHCSLDDRATTFAESFDEPDRPAVRDWYLAKLRREARARTWLMLRAILAAVLLAAALPGIALWIGLDSHK